ncbi:MAG: hypothetical protein JSW00_14275 [Thermoplasmata archaeon]|nr:MAG: hypothetical protein JSW00_14275 [Thermoplasmata archaeon]
MAVDDTMAGLKYDTIVYLKRSGTTRNIKAILEYPGPEGLMGLSGGERPVIDVYVENHIIRGISPAEIDTGGDKVQVPLRIGLTVKTVRIIDIVAQDRTIMHLRCQ